MPDTPNTNDRPQSFTDLFNRMEAVLGRIDSEFPELDSDEELSGADAVERITEIRIEAKAVLAEVQRSNGKSGS